MEDRTKTKIFAGAVIVGLAIEVRTARKIASQVGGPTNGAATTYYGAMSLYRTLAVYFGRKALEAEVCYWEVVRGA